jgi:hypothetical protein
LEFFKLIFKLKEKLSSTKSMLLTNLQKTLLGLISCIITNCNYDVQTCQVKISGVEIDQIVVIKEQTLPALGSTGKLDNSANYITNIFASRTTMISGMPAIVSIDKNNNCKLIIDNCAPYDIVIDRNDILGIMDAEPDNLIPLEDSTILSILQDIDKHLPKVLKKKLTKSDKVQKAHLNVPEQYKQRYIVILHKHQQHAISANKYDLGLATNFKHKIHLKDNAPVYQKQFKIPEAHQTFIEQSLDEWLKLGVVKHAKSLYNSPIFCVPKNTERSLCCARFKRVKQSFAH